MTINQPAIDMLDVNKSHPTYSFVVPIYNDADLAADFCAEFEDVFQSYLGVKEISGQVELIFVNDGSPKTNTMRVLYQVCDQYPFAMAIELSRNFGQHVALSCGYAHATGDYVGMLNVDMEDPPDQIPLLLNVLKSNDVDIVTSLRANVKRRWLESFTSHYFNLILNKLTGYDVPLNVGTLRVMNRRFIDAYNRLTETSRFIPGLEQWLGFKHDYLETRHAPRRKGKSSYNLQRRLLMALEAIVSFSDIPLRMTALLGAGIAALGLLMGLVLLIGRLVRSDFLPGYLSTIIVIVFLGGVQILVTGMASIYIGRILKEAQDRPLYIVRDIYQTMNAGANVDQKRSYYMEFASTPHSKLSSQSSRNIHNYVHIQSRKIHQ
ncbi:MAG: glycosyltransferase family 2 protein [Anaerolineae bacterium]|nr:glycosyltransferase family 2 protein [Anaerolineae bacterium]